MASVPIFFSWGEDMTEKEKYRQVRREAVATGIALLVLIVFWLFAGFGLADVGAAVYRTDVDGTLCFYSDGKTVEKREEK